MYMSYQVEYVSNGSVIFTGINSIAGTIVSYFLLCMLATLNITGDANWNK